jgi:integration host factor subunit alpha
VELVSIICDTCSFSQQESVQIVDQAFQIFKEPLERGDKAKFSGIGNFVTREKRPRRGRNHQTGEQVIISGGRVLIFKPWVMLRRVVNGENQSPEKIEIHE